MWEHILKKITAGRIPKTTRSENPFKRHSTTHQLKRSTTNLCSSWNKNMKVKTRKSNLVKYNQKIWSNLFINWDSEITVSAKISSSKQLVLTKITYVKFLKILQAKLWKKLLETTCTKNWKKLRDWPKSRYDVPNTNFYCKAIEVTKVIKNVNSKKSGWDETKKHSRTSPGVQFKEFSLTKPKIKPGIDWVNWKNHFKKLDPKNEKKNKKINVKTPHANNKPKAINLKLVRKKLGQEWTMNRLGKQYRKKFNPKNRKKQ